MINYLKYPILVTSLFLSGCTILWDDVKSCIPKTRTITVDHIEYVYQPVPDLINPPKYIPYEVKYIKYNDKYYYQLTLNDGEIMQLNYDRYKIWAETNFNILKNLKKQSKENYDKDR